MRANVQRRRRPARVLGVTLVLAALLAVSGSLITSYAAARAAMLGATGQGGGGLPDLFERLERTAFKLALDQDGMYRLSDVLGAPKADNANFHRVRIDLDLDHVASPGVAGVSLALVRGVVPLDGVVCPVLKLNRSLAATRQIVRDSVVPGRYILRADAVRPQHLTPEVARAVFDHLAHDHAGTRSNRRP